MSQIAWQYDTSKKNKSGKMLIWINVSLKQEHFEVY